MSTSKPSSPLDVALAGVPATFRAKLISNYVGLKDAASEGRPDQAGVRAGKFAEVALRLLQHVVTGSFTPFGTPIQNFADECRKLITANVPAVVESLRVIVPRALVFIYTVRNKRGIGHVGGDVDANTIDVAVITRVADWVMCEFIRVYHSLSLEEAQDIVDALASRRVPDVWEVGGKKRVLRKGLTARQQTLLLLYTDPSSVVLAEDLCAWVEYAQLSLFRRDVLRPLHKTRRIEYDSELDTVQLSPLGIQEVEELNRGVAAT